MSATPATQDTRTLTVLVYSDDAATRTQVRLAVGRRPAADLPRVTWLECATMPAVVDAMPARQSSRACRLGAICPPCSFRVKPTFIACAPSSTDNASTGTA